MVIDPLLQEFRNLHQSISKSIETRAEQRGEAVALQTSTTLQLALAC